MKLQDQCCTLEQAIRLKELGVFAESLGCFIGDPNPDPAFHIPYQFLSYEEAYHECGSSWFDSRIPAYSVAELGVMLPRLCHSFKGISNDDFLCCENFIVSESKGLFGSTEAHVRAMMLIWLIENKIITVEEVNNRLLSA
jgi:hypothetical protein